MKILLMLVLLLRSGTIYGQIAVTAAVDQVYSTWFDMFRIENDLIVEHWDYGIKASESVESSTFIQCEALCTFRRTGGAIERLHLLEQAADRDKAWAQLKNSCTDVTCRKCLWDLVVSQQDGKEFGLRPADQTKDCRPVRLL